ncbi:MAG: B12-binding domain-containing radical SAM protein [Verrucomicrobiae bacterium]|nr:B12-binding domain-containing radical SAM protein [Verrucomicrobiae bacterium]
MTRTSTRPALLVCLAAEDGAYMPSGRWEYRMKRLPHLGMGMLSASLKRVGIPARILDQSVHGYDLEGLVREVGEVRPPFVGLYSTVTQRGVVCGAVRALRATHPEVPVIVGGPDRVRSDLYLGAGAHAVAVGEGEELVVEIARALAGRAAGGDVGIADALEAIPGLLLPVEGAESAAGRSTGARAPIQDLDALPFPDRDAVPVDAYYDHHVFGMRLPYTTAMASRGCPYRCTFCDSPAIWGNKVRTRSPENVVAELVDLHERYGVRYVGFKDDQFAVKPDWQEPFLAQLTERQLDIKWSCLVHPYNFRRNREEKLRRFRDAGCDLLSFGLQAVDPKILKGIRRSTEEPRELAENVRVARQLGITTAVHFIFGLPGETLENMAGAIEWARATRPNYTVFFPLTVLEESELGRTHPDGPVTELSPEVLDREVNRAYRSVYGSPRWLLGNFLHVARKNPRWFLRAAAHAGYLARATVLNRVRFRVHRRVEAPPGMAAGPHPAYLAPYG